MLALCLALLENPEDEPRFELFYNKFYKTIFFIAKDHLHDIQLSEDCAQEVLMVCAKNFHNLSKDFNDPKLRNFIKVVSKCVAIDMYRKSQRRTDNVASVDVSEFRGVAEKDFDIFDEMQLKEAIDKMPDDYKYIFYLKYVCDYTGAEIAKMLDMSQPLVRKRCMLGMQFVKQYLRQDTDSK